MRIFPPELPTLHATLLASSPSDSQLWKHAESERLVIVTKDADFTHRILFGNPPPWVVHVRLGNLRLKEFNARMGECWPEIEKLLPANKLITVLPGRIEAIR